MTVSPIIDRQNFQALQQQLAIRFNLNHRKVGAKVRTDESSLYSFWSDDHLHSGSATTWWL
jgi:hypothetical protein